MFIYSVDNSWRNSNEAGAAVLAALILIGAVGLFSLTLHYLNSFYNDIAYNPQGQTAGVSLPQGAPNSATAPDICANPETDHDSHGNKYCKCNKLKTTKPSKAPTDNSGAPGTVFTNSTFSCLPGCVYKTSVTSVSEIDKVVALNTISLAYVGENPTSKPGQACTLYLCEDTTMNTCHHPPIEFMCDDNGRNCKTKSIHITNPGTPSIQPGQLSPDALEKAKEITSAAVTKEDKTVRPDIYGIASDYIGTERTPEKAGELWSALEFECRNTWGVSCANSKNTAINDLQAQLAALANSSDRPPVTPVPGGEAERPPIFLQCPPGMSNCLPLSTQSLQPPSPQDRPQSPPPPSGRRPPNTTFDDGFMGGLSSMFGGGGSGITNGIMSFLNGFARGMMGGGYMGAGGYGGYGGYGRYGSPPPGNSIPQYPGTCNTQYLCTGQTLLYRDSQCVDRPVQRCQYGCQPGSTQCMQQQYGQFGYGTDNQPCMQPPPQPSASSCTVGVWKPTSATGNGCVTGWQCVAGGQNSSLPTASLVCQSQVADVGTDFRIAYTCQNATESVGSGFDTGGQLSGTATVVIAQPPANYNTATYTLACTNGSRTVGAQCSVQVNNPTIALTANPSTVSSGATSTVGWVTSGMQTCVVSSPDIPGFTAQNANYTNVNGVAVTPALTATARVDLTCKTFGNNTRVASTIITVQ